MNATVRPPKQDERPRLAEIHAQAWNVDRPEIDDQELHDTRVLEADNRLVAVVALLKRQAWIGPDRVGAVGLGAVAVPPEQRRRGHCRRLLQGVLAEARDSGAAISLLWPSSHDFYRKLGWEVGGTSFEVEVPLAAFRAPSAPSWTATAVDPESPTDLTALDGIYSRWAQRYNGCLVRQPEDWQRKLVRRQERRFTYLLWTPAGPARAYVVYAFRELGDSERELQVRELAALDGEARQALMAFLGDHQSQARQLKLSLPPDQPLLYRLPAGSRTLRQEGFMLRLVDVERVLGALGGTGGETLTWQLHDPLCSWNSGTFQLEWEGPRCNVTRIPGAAGADLVSGVGTLSGLYAGHLSARMALELDLLTIDGRRDRIVALLEQTFGGRHGHLADYF